MLIDWFTVIAQIVNFLILVWLLKHFLYKPIIHAIDVREKRISGEFAAAAAKEAEAKNQLDDLRHKNETFENQRDGLLKQATADARAERQKLLDEARTEADRLRSKRQETLEDEERALAKEIMHRIEQEVFAVARKTLTDLAEAKLEKSIIDLFIHRLHDLNSEARALIAEDLKSSSPAIVRSGFELPQSQRSAIGDALGEVFACKSQIQFETAPYLVSGIEFSTNGHRIAWNIADYLESLEEHVSNVLEVSSKAVDQHAH